MINSELPTKKYRCIGVGVIWDRDRQRILIDRRLPNGELAEYWEFPGGKIEPNEDAIACIKREIQEELAIDVEVGDHLITIDHEYETMRVSLIVYHCTHLSGEPQAIEARSAAHHENPVGRHAAAIDGDTPVGFVGGDRHVSRSECPVLERQHQAIEEIAPAELRLIELRIEIVMIEHELLAEQLEEAADQEKQVRRIAGMDDVESTGEEHPPGEQEGRDERNRVLHCIPGCARSLDRQVVAVDVDAVDRLELALVTAPRRADDRNDIARVAKGASLLPDTAIERAGQVLYQNQYAFQGQHGIPLN